MASVVACTRCFPDPQASFMEVHQPRPPSHHRLFAKRRERLMPPGRCVSHGVRGRVLNFTLRVGDYSSLVKSPAMSAGKGNLATNLKGLCNVIWTIEADLDDGQHLYITGDPSALGSWKPDMATLMSPTEHCNLWKAEVKIACGVNFKYSYFIRGAQPSRDIIWRQGPTYSLSVPLFGEMNNKIMVRDSWTRFEIESHQHFPPSWGSWMDDTCYSVKLSVSDSTQDEGEILESLTGDLLEAKRLFNDLPANNDRNHVIEDSIHAISQVADSGGPLTEEYQPVEEPWLLQSSVSFVVPSYKMNSVFSKCKEHPPDDLTQPQVHNQHLQDVEKLLPEKVELEISLDGPSSTVILINSSICTMQRIAVLEDGKLVELLLEPVKNNVQCDSVYLGVITKLVPHMGGAFVNIGSSRPSLMGINHNREPFVFPLFHHIAQNKELDGSVHDLHRDHTVVHENEPISHEDIEVSDALAEVGFQDDPLQFVNHDLEEQEIKNDLYVAEVVKETLNESIINFTEVDDDFEDYMDITEQQIEGETVSDLHSIGTADINDSHLLNDPRNSSTGNKWGPLQKGTKIIVQVVKEGLGTKGPALTAYPKLRSRFWILITRCNKIGISKKISGAERTRLKVIAKTLQPEGFGLTVRTVAVGHSVEELKNDLEGLLSIWKNITAHAESATLAAEEGVEGAIPVLLHRAMGQTVSVVQDYFNEKVKRMVVDSPRTYHEVTNYLQEIAPDLCDRVELYNKRIPLFDEFNIEEEINNILNKRVPLVNGGSLVIEQTEALVSIDVNGGHGMLGQETSQEKAVLDVNIAAAKQIARELRLRDIGGIIVVDFIDMTDDSNKRMVYEEVKKTVMRDRSKVKVSELSKHGLMEITRKRVRPSVTFMISEPCTCCHATGRVEALETSFSKIEREICRLIAMKGEKSDPENPKSWPRLVLKVDQYMSNYLTSGKKTRLATLSSCLKVWILIKVARGFNRGAFEVKALTDDKVNDYHNRVHIPLLQSVGVVTHDRTRKVTIFPVKKSKAPQK